MNSLYLGRRQHGKTTLSLHHAQLRQESFGRGILAFDINSQIHVYPEYTVTGLDQLEELLEKKPSVIIYRPFEVNYIPSKKDELENQFSMFARMIWPLTNFVLIVDEAHWLQSANSCEPGLAAFVRQSDPQGIDLFQSAHAPADMWTRARGLASDWNIFRLTRESDLEAIESECGSEVREIVSQLPKYQYVHYNADDGIFEVVKDSESWHIKTRGVEVDG